jgi:hypothetical protein
MTQNGGWEEGRDPCFGNHRNWNEGVSPSEYNEVFRISPDPKAAGAQACMSMQMER